MWKRLIRFGHSIGCTKNETLAILFLTALLGAGWSVRWLRQAGDGPLPPLDARYREVDSLFAARASALPESEPADSGSRAAPGGRPAPARKALPARSININTATVDELCQLPGVGPSTARKIVEHRARVGRFRRVEDLLDVPSIGPAKLEKLRPCVTIK